MVFGTSGDFSANSYQISLIKPTSGCLSLKMSALRFFEMSVAVYQKTRRNSGKDLNRQQHHCENLRSCSSFVYLVSHKMQII